MITARLIPPLRLVIALATALAVLVQTVVLPTMASEVAVDNPDYAFLRWSVLALCVAWVGCLEVVMACIWRLLGHVQQARIFTPESFRWVNIIIGALAAATALALALLGVLLAEAVGPVTVPGVGLLGVVACVGAFLLMLVMRALLLQATTLRRELDGVI